MTVSQDSGKHVLRPNPHLRVHVPFGDLLSALDLLLAFWLNLIPTLLRLCRVHFPEYDCRNEGKRYRKVYVCMSCVIDLHYPNHGGLP